MLQKVFQQFAVIYLAFDKGNRDLGQVVWKPRAFEQFSFSLWKINSEKKNKKKVATPKTFVFFF